MPSNYWQCQNVETVFFLKCNDVAPGRTVGRWFCLEVLATQTTKVPSNNININTVSIICNNNHEGVGGFQEFHQMEAVAGCTKYRQDILCIGVVAEDTLCKTENVNTGFDNFFQGPPKLCGVDRSAPWEGSQVKCVRTTRTYLHRLFSCTFGFLELLESQD